MEYNSQNSDIGYNKFNNLSAQSKEFFELNRVEHGSGGYNINHFIGFFNTRREINIGEEILDFYSNFGKAFTQKNKATAKKEPYEFKERDTIRFTVGGTNGNFFEKSFGWVHDDWVSLEFDSKYESFFARTLKRGWLENYEKVAVVATWADNFFRPNPIGFARSYGIHKLVIANQHHFLAGRRSWRIGYGTFNREKLYFIETAAMERYSYAFVDYALSDLAGLRDTIDDIWSFLIVNYAKLKKFKILPHYIPDGYDFTFGSVLRRTEEHESFDVATSQPWFQEVIKRHPGLIAKPLK